MPVVALKTLVPACVLGSKGQARWGSFLVLLQYTANLAGFLHYTFVTKQHCEGMIVTPQQWLEVLPMNHLNCCGSSQGG